jgi:prophage antirepressor-like protein
MNNQIIPFNFENKTVHTVIADGIPWFVAKDVCNVLGLSKYRTVLETTRKDSGGQPYVNFPEDEKGVLVLGHLSGGNQKTLCVNEPGLYRLVHRAHTPEAEQFKRKVYHEILPQIRRTGMYVPEDVKDVITKIPLTDAIPAIEAAMRQDGCSINTIWLVMGIVETLLSYIATYQAEFELWKKLERCEQSKKRATPKDYEEIRELHKAGYTKKEISSITYRGRTVINNALRETVAQPCLFDDEPSESFGEPLVDAGRGHDGGAA